MAYTPPDSKYVELDFSGTYTAPDARLVVIDLIPPPVGTTQVVYPSAVVDSAVGAPHVRKTPAMAPAGFDAAEYGAPAVANLSQGIFAAGSEFAQLGMPEKVWNFHTFVRNITMQDQSLYGEVWASFYRRYLQMAGGDVSLFGVLAADKEDLTRTSLRYVSSTGLLAGAASDFNSWVETPDFVFLQFVRAYPALNSWLRYDKRDGSWLDISTPTDGTYYYSPQVNSAFFGGYIYAAFFAPATVSLPYQYGIAKIDLDGNVVSYVTVSAVDGTYASMYSTGARLYFVTAAGDVYDVNPTTLATTLRCSTEAGAQAVTISGHLYIYTSSGIIHIPSSTGAVTDSTLLTGIKLLTATSSAVLAYTDDGVVHSYDLSLAPLGQSTAFPYAGDVTGGMRDRAVGFSDKAVLQRYGFSFIKTERAVPYAKGSFPPGRRPRQTDTDIYTAENLERIAVEMMHPRPDEAGEHMLPGPGPLAVGEYRWSDLILVGPAGHNRVLLRSTLEHCYVPGGAGYHAPEIENSGALIIVAEIYIDNEFTELVAPPSIPALALGAPLVRNNLQYVTLNGGQFSHVSEADFQLKTRYLSPPAIEGQQFGAFEIRYLTTVVAPAGFDAAAVPQAVVTDRAQHIYAGTVVQSALFEPPRVHNRNAYITPDSADQLLFPNFLPVVLNFTRELYPTSIDLFRSGTATIANKAVAVSVSGANQNLYGTVNITNWHQYREPAGFDAAALGEVVVALVQKVAHPSGADALQFGAVAVTDKVRFCAVDSVDPPFDTTEPWISHRVRSFGTFGNIAPPEFGTPEATQGVRYLLPPTFYPSIFGTVDIMLARRTLEPPGVFFASPADAFGAPRLSPRVQEITPLGFYQEVVGTPAAARNEIALDSISAGDQTRFGTTQAELSIRVVQQKLSRDFAEFSLDTRVWNWRQYASTWSPSVPDVLGTPYIENRNKTLLLIGTNFGKISRYLDVSNKARLVPTAGDDLSRFGDTLVAPRIRTVSPTGYDAADFGIWFVVYNTRKIIETSGIPRPYAGVPKVWRNEIVTDAIGGFSSAQFGRPMVAPRIRTVVEYPFADPTAGFPYVGLSTQYVAPSGITSGFGVPFVEEHFTVFKPFGSNYARYGEPVVWNNTPEIHLTGIDSPPLPPAPWVSFRVRTIDLAGQAPGEYQPERPDVSFKTRYIYPLGNDLQILSRKADIRWDMPELPAQTVVAPLGIEAPGSEPVDVHTNVISPLGIEPPQLGRPESPPNGIWMSSVTGYFMVFGDPEVTYRNRRIYITSANTVFEPSNVFMFPAHIVFDTNEHPEHAMDAALANTEDGLARPFFGKPEVTNQHRSMQIVGLALGQFGIPALATNKLAPESWVSTDGKFGMPDFAGPLWIFPYWGRSTEDYIPEVPSFNFDTAGYGTPTVAYPVAPPVYDPNVRPLGADHQAVGGPFVESTIRNVYPQSIDSMSFGTSWAHPPFRLLPDGFDSATFGDTFTAFRIRTVFPQGDDHAAVCLEEAETIAMRMRIRHGVSRDAVSGFAAGSFGTPLVADRVRTIYPQPATDGSAVQPAKAWPVNTFYPTGHDSAQLGVVRRAVFGELYPAGVDVLVPGYGRVNRRVTVAGIAADALAPARIARPIRPTGNDCAGYEPPAVTNTYGCRNRVVISQGTTYFTQFGDCHVTH